MMERMTDDIRRAVRVELAKRDFSQAELARQLGMAPQYLSNMMRGKVSRMPEAWQKVLDALGLELVAVPKDDA